AVADDLAVAQVREQPPRGDARRERVLADLDAAGGAHLPRQQAPFHVVAATRAGLAQLAQHRVEGVAALDGDARALLEAGDRGVGEAVVAVERPERERAGQQRGDDEQGADAAAGRASGAHVSGASMAKAGCRRASTRCAAATAGCGVHARAPARATGRIPRTALHRKPASADSTSATDRRASRAWSGSSSAARQVPATPQSFTGGVSQAPSRSTNRLAATPATTLPSPSRKSPSSAPARSHSARASTCS